jgi:hypothetical protein
MVDHGPAYRSRKAPRSGAAIARWSCARALGFDAVLVEDPQTGQIERLGIADLRPATAEAADGSTTNLNDLSDGDWAEARRRREQQQSCCGRDFYFLPAG